MLDRGALDLWVRVRPVLALLLQNPCVDTALVQILGAAYDRWSPDFEIFGTEAGRGFFLGFWDHYRRTDGLLFFLVLLGLSFLRRQYLALNLRHAQSDGRWVGVLVLENLFSGLRLLRKF